jgi:hypothetical protein
MAGRDYLYFLMRDDGRFCYEDNGVVLLSSAPSPLKYTPDGWLDIAIQRQRNAEYFALERSFTVPLNFVKDGALILKYYYYNKGIEEKLYLSIAEKKLFYKAGSNLVDESGNIIYAEDGVTPLVSEDVSTYGFYYSLLYKGEVDFSQFSHQGEKVVVTLMEGGTAKLLKANKNTTYDIAMTPSILVKMDGINLQQKALFLVTDGVTGGGYADSTLDDHIMALTFISQEAISSIGALNQERFKVDSNNTADMWNANQYFLLTGASQTIATLTWDFFVTPGFIPGDLGGQNDGAELHLEFHVISSASEHPISQVIQVRGGGSKESFYDQPQHFSGSIAVSIPANSRAILYMSISQDSNKTRLVYALENSSFDVTYTYRKAITYVKAMRLKDLFNSLCVKMGIPAFYSNLLQKTYPDIVVTCGDAIRGISGAVIKTSIGDAFTSVNAVIGAALAVDGVGLRLESKDYFVDYANPIDLGECKNLKVAPATDYLYNTIKIGYREQNYDDVNGKQEFNNTHVYTTPITRITKELNLVSVYRADSYGIEFARINLEGKTTTDSSGDNDVFFLHIKDSPATGHDVIFTYYDIDRTLNPYVTAGSISPSTVFNLYLTPKQNLFRNKRFIHSCFYKMDDQYLKFQTTQKNSALVVHVTAQDPIVEKADVEIAKLGDRLFVPILFEFENKVPSNILDLLKSNPRKSYSFINNGMRYTGFPQKDSVQPASRKEQSFQLLASPLEPLNYLINYNG